MVSLSESKVRKSVLGPPANVSGRGAIGVTSGMVLTSLRRFLCTSFYLPNVINSSNVGV